MKVKNVRWLENLDLSETALFYCCWARNSDFIWKARRLRREQTSIPKNHLPGGRTQASFILKEEGVKSWVPSHFQGDVLIPSFLHPFTGRVRMFPVSKSLLCARCSHSDKGLCGIK